MAHHKFTTDLTTDQVATVLEDETYLPLTVSVGRAAKVEIGDTAEVHNEDGIYIGEVVDVTDVTAPFYVWPPAVWIDLT